MAIRRRKKPNLVLPLSSMGDIAFLLMTAAGIGMASAAGLYVLAVVTTVLSLIGLEVFGFILFRDRRVARRRAESDKGGDR